MPRPRTAYGWKEGGRIALSTSPRGGRDSVGQKPAVNLYATASDALRDATLRGMTVQWDNPDLIDR